MKFLLNSRPLSQECLFSQERLGQELAHNLKMQIKLVFLQRRKKLKHKAGQKEQKQAKSLEPY